MRVSRIGAATAAFLVVGASAVSAQNFENGQSLGAPREGFINLRTDLDGFPVAIEAQGKEKLTLAVSGETSWRVEIPKNAVRREIVRFLDPGNVTAKEGVGAATVELTSRSSGTVDLTVTLTTSGGTSTIIVPVTSFMLKPRFEPQPKKPDAKMEIGGVLGGNEKRHVLQQEVKTKIQQANCNYEGLHKFEDGADSCDIKADLINTSDLHRHSIVSINMRSEFTIRSVPQVGILTGKPVNAEFTAEEAYAISKVKAHMEHDSSVEPLDVAGWQWSGTHSASAEIQAPAIPIRQAIADAFPGTVQHNNVTLADDLFVEGTGIQTPQTPTFSLNAATNSYYKVHRTQASFINKLGSWVTGDVTYDQHPLLVRIVPIPLF